MFARLASRVRQLLYVLKAVMAVLLNACHIFSMSLFCSRLRVLQSHSVFKNVFSDVTLIVAGS